MCSDELLDPHNSSSDLADVMEQINNSFPACSRKSPSFPVLSATSMCVLFNKFCRILPDATNYQRREKQHPNQIVVWMNERKPLEVEEQFSFSVTLVTWNESIFHELFFRSHAPLIRPLSFVCACALCSSEDSCTPAEAVHCVRFIVLIWKLRHRFLNAFSRGLVVIII